MHRTTSFCFCVGFVVLLTLILPATRLQADDLFDWSRDFILPKDFDFNLPTLETSSESYKANRIRLFRIMPGFLSDPAGLEDDTTSSDPTLAPSKDDDGPKWLEVAVGDDNPFFDVRFPNDPGGIGYTMMQTQLQLINTASTGCTVGFKAVTPTGLDQGGVEDGATVVSPAFSVFHALRDGTAFQGFLSKNINVNNPVGVVDTLSRSGQFLNSVEYGMAVQRPLLPEMNNAYLFLEALGRSHYDPTTANSAAWEVLPGMHFKVSDSWWLSGSLILPVQRTQTDTLLWQVTCSFQF